MMEALGEAPLAYVESLVTEDTIVEALREMLPLMNADTATLKVVMQKLAVRLGMEFADIKAQWRPRIKALLPDMLELCSGGDVSENESEKVEADGQEEDDEEEDDADFRPSRKRTASKRNAVMDASDDEGEAGEDQDSDASEARPEDKDDAESEDEDDVAPVKKRRTTNRTKKRKSNESTPPAKKAKTVKQVDPPGLASLKELGRAAGVLNPRVYKLLKMAETTDEAEEVLRERLQDAGVSFNGLYPTSRDISAAKRKHAKDKELEGIDTSLIITGARIMPSYSQEPEDAQRAAKARGSHLRVHFKHCREVSHAIKGMPLNKAKSFLQAVLEYKQAVPFTKFTGGCGRHAQGKLRGAAGDKCKWPQKATKIILDLVKNAEANAEVKGLDTDLLYISHAQANAAIKQRRRTYRAHGRIGPYMSNPAHIELILTEKRANVAKAVEEAKPVKVSRKRQAQLRLKSGGGVPAN
ncbi:hypothetical protein JG687_00000132 [Phytophthora cactorum]|nr:hypothetical protein JG687_00000132 [Phytophthora cactorum]